jgi:lysophospholipase L1-like esterase
MQIAKQTNGYHRRTDHLPLFAKRVLARLTVIPLALLIGGFSLFAVRSARGGEAFSRVRQAHRVVMLGDSITHSGEYIDFIDTYLTLRFPERRVEFLNLGLPSETVSGLSEDGHAGGQFPRPVLQERLDRVLEKTKPDLVIACYGMNDGIYLPFDEARFRKFKEGMLSLHRKVTASGAKIIHATPPVFDEIKGGHPGYADTLDRYSDWLLAQRSAGWDVVDLHGPTSRHLAGQRAGDPNYFLAADGIHPGEAGHWIMARSILSYLGAEEVAGLDDPKAMLASHPHGEELLRLIRERQRMMRDAWMTDIGYKRPGLSVGLPMADAMEKAAGLDSRIHDLVMPLPGRKSARQDFDNAREPWQPDDLSKSMNALRITASLRSVAAAAAR